ncbi:glycosyltransferase family 39 protein [Salinimicrobium terrae]|uniref:glycosyltransferase family 39 protein n=1 Tax=Salinimicrobium terrae TaxID=470866 RepID=UPI0012EB7DA4|nr:glycosyltransferase family 39 protein [Salinimicrobium terrae]
MQIKQILKIGLGFILVLMFSYNWIVANEIKSDPGFSDAFEFLYVGLSLAKTGQYGYFQSTRKEILNDFNNPEVIKTKTYIKGESTAFRPPIWPLIIAGIFFVFGYSLTNILIFKFLIHLLGIYIFHKTLKLLNFKEYLTITGTFLYAISPAWQLYSRLFLSEPITYFFITLWIYLLIKYIQNKISIIPQACVAGIIILCHPYSLFLPFSVWFIMFLTQKLKLKVFIISSVICISIVSLWVVRNMVAFNTQEIIITTSSGEVLAKGWNEKVPKEHTNTQGDLIDVRELYSEFDKNLNKDHFEVARMKFFKGATINFLKNNPELIFPIISKKIKSAFNPLPESRKAGILEIGRWFFQLLSFLSMIYLLLWSKNKLIKSLIFGLIFSTIGISLITYSGFRFRMPQVGLELLFIIFVLDDIIQRIKGKINPQASA